MERVNLNDIFPFTPLERAFRHVHLNGMEPASTNGMSPELNAILAEAPKDAEDYTKILRLHNDDSLLREAFFFQDDIDVFIMRHPRYMPQYPHAHYFFEVQFVLSGALTQTIKDSTFDLVAGDVCFVAPETSHAPYIFDDDTLMINLLIRRDTFRSTFMNLLNENDIISDFFNRTLYKNSFHPFLLCHTGDDNQLHDIILRMMYNSENTEKFTNRLQCVLLQEFFIYLLQAHELHFVVAPDNEENENIVAILRYIQSNFRTVTLSQTARHFNYSEVHLSRMVKAYAGDSFSNTLKTIKLQHAADRLANSNTAIADIVEDIGYDGNSYFYRAFKNQYGQTPMEYRQSKKAAATPHTDKI